MSSKDPDQFKQKTTAVMRAMSRKPDLEVLYSEIEPQTGEIKNLQRPRIPAPTLNMPEQIKRLIRGCADTYALKLAHHDVNIHRNNGQSNLQAQAALDALEQARCDALGMTTMAGVADNLDAVLSEKLKKRGYIDIDQREDVPLADALHIYARSKITGRKPPEAAQKIMEKWEGWFDEHAKGFDFDSLKPLLKNQASFNKAACSFLSQIGLQIDGLDDNKNGSNEQQDQETAPEPEIQDQEDSSESEQQSDPMDGTPQDGGAQEEGDESFDMDMEEILDGIDSELMMEEDMPVPSGRPREFAEFVDGLYTVYTTEFDEEVRAEELADQHEMERLRALLDQQLTNYQNITTKLANRLQRKLMAKQRRSWKFDLEEGVLDSSRLAGVIANPDVPLTFKAEVDTPFKDTVVSILIDNSGSMRGRPIAIAAMTTDIIAQTLERCGLKTEILGFTTRAWKGGKARELWIENGKPEKPGRLNDIRHIIYKSANTPVRRSRRNLGLMLKEGLLKENIDGEALVWAYNRLSRRPEDRKILMVISDGAPVDDSTLSVNPSNILEMDLRSVIRFIEEKSNIELTAIGIGHDVTRHYKNAITISDADDLAEALTAKLTDLFEEQT
ncbi:MAG: cobaltochelatase subunit CobT [Alphaproteobacteria bacterium]|nr:cobaltochelatase subunit CobT [Alphaproteobacteria bacterium]